MSAVHIDQSRGVGIGEKLPWAHRHGPPVAVAWGRGVAIRLGDRRRHHIPEEIAGHPVAEGVADLGRGQKQRGGHHFLGILVFRLRLKRPGGIGGGIARIDTTGGDTDRRELGAGA